MELSNQKPIRGVVCILLNTNSMYTERYKEWEGFRRSWHCRKKQGKGYKDGLALCAAGLATMAGALEKESWDEGDIADRAEWLADKALEVWR